MIILKLIFLAVIGLLLLSACAPADSIGEPADFSMYSKKLNEDLEKAGLPPIDMSNTDFYAFKTVSDNRAGTCSRSDFSKNKISVFKNTDEFAMYTYFIFTHEVFHCFLNLGHSDNPNDIMSPKFGQVNLDLFVNEETRLIQLKEAYKRVNK